MPRHPLRPGRALSLLYVAGVYVLAVAAAWAVFRGTDLPPQMAMVLGLLAATGVTYLATLHVDNGSVFDPWWSVLPPFVALFLTDFSEHPRTTPRQVAVLAVVWFWGVRLTANWVRGWPGLAHEDWRYEDLYRDWPLPKWAVRLLAVELVPTLIVILGCLPLYPALCLGDASFGLLDVLALAIGLSATSIEMVADEQMHAFKRTPSPGALMDQGLWRYSRHPNYFGEICFWVALWFFAVSAAPGWWWTGIGAVAMILMFVFASIPMLDRRSSQRRPAYADYARRTSALVPWPPREP